LSCERGVEIVVANHVEHMPAIRQIRSPRKALDLFRNGGCKIQIRIEQVDEQLFADRRNPDGQRTRRKTCNSGDISRATQIDLVDGLSRRRLWRRLQIRAVVALYYQRSTIMSFSITPVLSRIQYINVALRSFHSVTHLLTTMTISRALCSGVCFISGSSFFGSFFWPRLTILIVDLIFPYLDLFRQFP